MQVGCFYKNKVFKHVSKLTRWRYAWALQIDGTDADLLQLLVYRLSQNDGRSNKRMNWDWLLFCGRGSKPRSHPTFNVKIQGKFNHAGTILTL